MMKRYVLAIVSTLLLLSVAPGEAHADTYVGLDAGAAVPIPDSFTVEPQPGPAVNLRLGYRLPIPVAYLSGEVLGSWQNFPHDESPQRVLSGRAGFRLGIDAALAVKLFGHIGYTNLSGEGTDYTIDVSGLSYDGGLALDLTILPIVDLGVHGAYVSVADKESNVNWVEAGVHVEFSF